MPDSCLDVIREKIDASPCAGITVAEYMSLCLSHPEYGYYVNNDPFGTKGDFVTAPEISQLFGDLIGGFFVQNWVRMGRVDKFALVEIGPGRGTLMADIWRTANKALPDFCQAAQIHLVEISPVLREKQKQKLKGLDVKWHDTIDSLPKDMPLILVANEFFDALPIRQYILERDYWFERLVGWNEMEESLDWVRAAEIADIKAPPHAKDGDIFEICLDAEEIMNDLCHRLKNQRGLMLFIDYGYVAKGCGDTLQALHKHERSNVLEMTGEQDITAHVDFHTLQKIAEKEGVQITGPVTQSEFLNSLGIEQYTEKLQKQATPEQVQSLTNAYHRLTSGFEMGYLFKVLGVSY